MAVLAGCGHSPPQVSRVSIIGDSYTGGTPYGGKGPRGWPSLASEELRREGVAIDAAVGYQGGSGYVHPGNRDGGVFSDQVPIVVRPEDRLTVLFGSRNDKDTPAEELASAVARTFAEVTNSAPSTSLLVIGTPWLKAEVPSAILRNRDIVRSQADAFGATFIDPIAEGWFVDRPELIASDGVHPTDDGHAYMAEKIAPLIARQLRHPSRR